MKKWMHCLLALLLVFPLTALAEDVENSDAGSSLEVGDIVIIGHYEQDGVPTTYLIQLCSTTNGLQNTSAVYWLRTPGDTQEHAAYVFGGRVNLGGWGGNIHKLPIRPAMWISIDAAS